MTVTLAPIAKRLPAGAVTRKRDPVVAGVLAVLEHRRHVVHVADDDVGIAVVVEVADGEAAADPRDLQAAGRRAADTSRKRAAVVQQELVLLP